MCKKRMAAAIREMEKNKKGEKERVCLQCGKSFLSAGPGNRKCQACKNLISMSYKNMDSKYREHRLYIRQFCRGQESDVIWNKKTIRLKSGIA